LAGFKWDGLGFVGRKTFYTMAQFIERLSSDVLPLIFEREPGVD
jgi:hypothetical protein